jgi:hypothetical protein
MTWHVAGTRQLMELAETTGFILETDFVVGAVECAMLRVSNDVSTMARGSFMRLRADACRPRTPQNLCQIIAG